MALLRVFNPFRAASGGRRSSPATIALIATAVMLGALSFTRNHAMVRDLEWPAVDIEYRELAAAQTILDEGFGPDSTYLGERIWYNPMAALAVAAASRISGLPPNIVVTRSGPWVNLLAPLALFALTAILFNRFAALAAVAAFIFISGSGFTFHYAASYSPWFAPQHLGQAFFYVTLIVALRAFEPEGSQWRAAGLGVLLGLTFLTHTAPALVLGLVMVVLALAQAVASRAWRPAALTLGAALLVAFVVASPFIAEILGYYHLKIVNPYPGESPSDLLDLNELPGVVAKLATIPAIAALLLGFRSAATLSRRGMRLLMAWSAALAFFLGSHFVALLAERAGLYLPAVVPAYHFFFYLAALISVAFGVALCEAAHAAVRWMDGRRARDGKLADTDGRAGVLVCVVSVLLVAIYYPSYLGRDDFTDLRARAVMMNQQFPVDAYEWIRENTSNDDVFLSADDESLYVIAPAGRKVVATNRYFSSPYVDWASRDRDRARMFALLERKDFDGFRTLAGRYGVAYILLPEAVPSAPWLKVSGLLPADVPAVRASDLAGQPGFDVVFRGARVSIVAARPASR